ncbi:MAG: GNAT family N-acetyltransferase [Armatimonadota bacterium]
MSLHIRTGRMDDIDAIARIVAQAFGGDTYRPHEAANEVRREIEIGVRPEHALVAEKDGSPVGVAVGIPFHTWVGGVRLRLMGVASVAVAWNARRQGVARTLMEGLLNRAKDEGYHLTALYPFRPSFYQTFGFGSVEQEHCYDIPTSFLPQQTANSVELQDSDLAQVKHLYQRAVETSSFCNERSDPMWTQRWSGWKDCMRIGVRDSDHLTGYVVMKPAHNRLEFREMVWDSPASLRALLGFLRSLSDQYTHISLRVPADVALWPTFRETQLDPGSSDRRCSIGTEGMAKLVDIPAAFQARPYPAGLDTAVQLCVWDPLDNSETFWGLEIKDGRANVSASPSPALPAIRLTTMALAQWYLGTFTASALWRVGALETESRNVLPILDACMAGPQPYNRERY